MMGQQSSSNSWLLPHQGALNQEEADENVNIINGMLERVL